MGKLPIHLENGFVLLEDVVVNTVTESGLYIPGDEQYNRFARVVQVGDDSVLNEGDIVIKPIGRASKIRLNDKVYDCMRECLIFAKVIE